MMRSFLAAAAVAALGLSAAALPASPALAQSGTPPGQSQSGSFSADDLKSFAAAQLEVERVSQSLRADAQDVSDRQRLQEMRRKANEEMTQAVREAGLSVEKYNEIASASVDNQSLADEIDEYKNELQ